MLQIEIMLLDIFGQICRYSFVVSDLLMMQSLLYNRKERARKDCTIEKSLYLVFVYVNALGASENSFPNKHEKGKKQD